MSSHGGPGGARRRSTRAARPGAAGVEAGQGRVAAIQRTRMLNAMVDVASERGAGRVSVAHIVARAGVSRRTFYEHFEDRESCFLAAFDHAVALAGEAVLPAYAGRGSWRERLRVGLGALLAFCDEQPGLGGLLVVDTLSAGPAALVRRAGLLDVLVAVVDEGRGEGRAGKEAPPLAAEGVVGAVFNVLHTRLLEQRAWHSEGTARSSAGVAPGSLLELLNPFMSMIVMPYLGTAAAQRELRQPVPAARPVEHPGTDPLRDLDMRLTYRTVRALVAIAANPGASNRRIAEIAGVSDQGQISKLLTRLEHLGLIENLGDGPTRGEPNSWTLTAKGAQVEQAIRIETGSAG